MSSPHHVAVAYSGGRDSTALLHATLAACEPLDVQVVALHVHHGLSPNADAWLDHCEAQCNRWRRAGRSVGFAAHRLTGPVPAGESVEAWARAARYRALAEMARAADVSIVLLAHHRRDQVETFVLQALRGAGIAGLASMPRSAVRDGIDWCRPWLGRSPTQIDSYVRRHRLRYIDDESNDDPRFARNRLRLKVWPALEASFGEAETGLAAAAAWAGEARSLIDEIAAIDLVAVADGACLDIGRWAGLSPARRSNVLRAWLKSLHSGPAPASLVVRLQNELSMRGDGRWPLGNGELRFYRQRLSFELASAARVDDPAMPREPEPLLRIDRDGEFHLPGWGGSLWVERVGSQGVPLGRLAQVELRPRSGGERFRRAPNGPARSLKKQYQAAGLPSWVRQGPLIWRDGQLIFVPGLGLDAGMIKARGDDLATLRWQPLGAPFEAPPERPIEALSDVVKPVDPGLQP